MPSSPPLRRAPRRLWPLAAVLCAACTASLPSMEGVQHAPAGATAVAPILITPQLLAEQDAARRRQLQDLSVFAGPAAPYAIGPGDLLSITVWGHPELAAAQLPTPAPQLSPSEQAAAAAVPGFLVGPDGSLQFPFAGALHVAGLSEQKAGELLAAKLARVLNQPSVTLRVLAFRSQRIYVDGEVKAPGLQPLDNQPMHLVEALNRAGGMLPSADQSRITIVRAGISYPVNLPALIRHGGDPTAILLRHGDLVRVASGDEGKVFLTGEVTTPKAVTMHSGRLTLNEALGEAGGVSPVSGDARQIYVVRRVGDESQVFRLDARQPGALAIAEHFELSARDTVFVAPNGLTSWNRTLSLLIPGSLPAAVGTGTGR
jgi:polysaccharide export outer membrane protein